MGYYSNFSLKITDAEGNEASPEVYEIAKFHFSILGVMDEVFDDDFESCSSSKWYDYKGEVAYISELMTPYILVLKRDGEESGDHELSYFSNGMVQVAQARLVYDDFNENELFIPYDYKGKNELVEAKERYKGLFENQKEELEKIKKRAEVLSKLSEEDKELLGL